MQHCLQEISIMIWGIHGVTRIIWIVSWIVLPVYGILLVIKHKKRRKYLGRFGEPTLLYGVMADDIWKTEGDAQRARSANPHLRMRVIRDVYRYRTKIKEGLVFASCILILIALGRPQWGARQEIVHHEGIDMVVCIDTSNSMLAQDIAPNRITAASNAVRTMLPQLDGNRVGLVSFASTTRIHSPLTLDYRVIQSILDHSLSIGPGTDIEAAVDAGLTVLENSDANTKALVILSDGEDHEGNIDRAIQKAHAADVSIFALGIGTPGGAPIPEDGDKTGYIRYQGELVWTKLEDNVLIQMTDRTGGQYFRMTPALTEAIEMAHQIRKLEKTEFSQAVRMQRDDQFGIFVMFAILFLSVEAILNRFGTIRWEAGDDSV
jgi:Ca-activated chloride channel homolog